jgi:hypothetical protein
MRLNLHFPSSKKGLTLAIILMLCAVLILVITGVGALSQQQSGLAKLRGRQAEQRYSSWSASQMALLQLSREPDRVQQLAGPLPDSVHDFQVLFFNNRTGTDAIEQDGILIPKGAVLLKSVGVVNGQDSEPMYSLAFELTPRFEAAVFGQSSIRVIDSVITARSEVAWEMAPTSPYRRPILLASRQQVGGGNGGGPSPMDPGPVVEPGPSDGGGDSGLGPQDPVAGGGIDGEVEIDPGGGSDGPNFPGGDNNNDGGDPGTHLAGLSTNSQSTNSIVLQGSTTVDGDVNFGLGSDASVPPDFSARVEGEIGTNERDLPLAPVRLPENSPPQNSTPAPGNLSSPGRYGSFNPPPGSTLNLQEGVYIFDGNVNLQDLDLQTSGPVKIYITGDLTAEFARLHPAGDAASNLQIFIIGEHQVNFDNVQGEGTVMGDKAELLLTHTELTGAVVGNSIEITNNSVLQYDDRVEALDFEGASEWIQRSILTGNR